MIRVLQMIGSLGVGGSQTMILNIYRNIDRSKMQFDFVVDHTDPYHSYFVEEVKAMGAKVYTMPGFNGANAAEIKREWNNFFYLHPEYKVLHSHVRSYASLYLPVAKKHGVKTIIHSHSTSNGTGAMAMAKNAMQYPLKKQADILMACSTEAGRWLYGDKAMKSDKYILMPNGVDLERFSYSDEARKRLRKELGIEGKFVVGHVGRYLPDKNHAFLLEAFAKLHEKQPNSVLLLVGEGGAQLEAAQKAVKLGIAEHVIMTGNRSDVPELLSAMDIFAFPSIREGLPMTLIEAQANGLTCLISDRISPDVDISPLIKRMPIDDAERWAWEMLGEHKRQDVKDDIRKAGFDVKESAKKMAELYRKLHKEAK
ncbi:MAG: glycosyltransferase family 1 protein [Oscillospiraceae bacterium]|nr:glycosyltransferase family 1 protein [Oscillospiraceae bacterium]